jgi:hypothetical protein
MTPRQFFALLKRHKQHQERERVLVASLQCVIANFSMCRPTEPLTVDDFIERGKPERSNEEIAADITAKFQILSVRPGVPMPTHLIR